MSARIMLREFKDHSGRQNAVTSLVTLEAFALAAERLFFLAQCCNANLEPLLREHVLFLRETQRVKSRAPEARVNHTPARHIDLLRHQWPALWEFQAEQLAVSMPYVPAQPLRRAHVRRHATSSYDDNTHTPSRALAFARKRTPTSQKAGPSSQTCMIKTSSSFAPNQVALASGSITHLVK